MSSTLPIPASLVDAQSAPASSVMLVTPPVNDNDDNDNTSDARAAALLSGPGTSHFVPAPLALSSGAPSSTSFFNSLHEGLHSDYQRADLPLPGLSHGADAAAAAASVAASAAAAEEQIGQEPEVSGVDSQNADSSVMQLDVNCTGLEASRSDGGVRTLFAHACTAQSCWNLFANSTVNGGYLGKSVITALIARYPNVSFAPTPRVRWIMACSRRHSCSIARHLAIWKKFKI